MDINGIKKYFQRSKLRNIFLSGLDKLLCLSLIIVLGFLGYHIFSMAGNYLSIGEAQVNIDSPEYQKYIDTLQQDKDKPVEPLIDDAPDTPPAPGPVIDEERVANQPLLDEILTVLTSIAFTTKQPLPTGKAMDSIYKACKSMKEHTPLEENLSMLKKQLTIFRDQASRLNGLDKMDLIYHNWADFLDYYFTRLKNNIAENERVIREQEIANAQLAADIVVHGKIALIAAAVFVVLTLFFVIICIERNTRAMRQLREALAETAPNSNPASAVKSQAHV